MSEADDALVEAMAKADAAFDEREWLGMGRVDRERYLARAGQSLAIARPAIRREALKEAKAAVENERLHYEPETAEEITYNIAIEHAAAAILALGSDEPASLSTAKAQ